MANVLVIEDDTELANIISMALSAYGHVVRVAGTLTVALDAIRAEWPNVIALDLDLNGRYAGVIIDEVRQLPHRVSFLFLSAASPERTFDTRETDDWIAKPFDVSLLQRKVDRLVESDLSCQKRDREPKD